MNIREAVRLTLTLPQLILAYAQQRHKRWEAGRGSGKSTSIGVETSNVAHSMPRCSAVIGGESYLGILTKTLPSTIEAWAKLGYYKDYHYTIGKRAPDKFRWPEAYQAPGKYDHSIHWYTGATFILVSQDRPGSGRGPNTSHSTCDEMCSLTEDFFLNEVMASNRVKRKEFFDSPYDGGSLLCGTTAISELGKWVFKDEELARKHPELYLYLRSASQENKDNLRDDYFEGLKRTMPDFMYRSEILNERIIKIEGCFYANLLEEYHCYSKYNYDYYDSLNYNVLAHDVNCKGDGDLNMNEPLHISVDWGASINCMVVCQQHGDEFRFLKNLFVKSPLILDDLFKQKFIPYYQAHQKKEIHFWYDRSGNSRVANSNVTFAEQAKKILQEAGWKVHMRTQGLDPAHQDKYVLWQKLLKEDDARMPIIRINKHNCKELIISMQNAPVIDYKGVHKDKRSEKNDNIPQEEATHFSDAADIVVYGNFSQFLEAYQHTSIGKSIVI